jgi:hypothetical protein
MFEIQLDAILPQVKHGTMREKCLCHSVISRSEVNFLRHRAAGVTLKNNLEKLRRANHLPP